MVIKKFLKNSKFIIFLLFLFSAPASLPLIFPGFYEPHDLHHIADIYQMFSAIQSGQLPPRLGPDFTFGYGYPLFNFYYLLPFYIGAFWYSLIGSLTASFKFVFLVSSILSVFGMYLFLREFFGKFSAIVGSALFLYSPYRAVEIYVRGAMGEALALSLLPFVAWSLVRVVKNPKNYMVIAASSLILALFVISHNYLFVLAAPALLLLVLLLTNQEKGKSQVFLSLTKVAVIASGLTAYWWLPALIEQRLVASVTPFLLKDHFPFIKQLIIPSWGYGSSVWGPGDGLSFQIGLVNLAVVVASFALIIFSKKLFKDRKISTITLWALIGFFVSVFMMNIRSLFIWRLIPFYNFIQFPWRLLFLTTFFSAVLSAVISQILPKKRAKIAGFLIVAGALVLTTQYFRPSKIVFKKDGQYLTRFFESETYSEDYLLLPNWVSQRPEGPPKAKIESEKGLVTNIQQINPIFWRAEVSAEDKTKVTFNTYYFPGWFAKVDGNQAEIKPGEPYGQIELQVPEGEHSVEFFWKETPLRRSADYISLTSLFLVIGLLAYPRIKSRVEPVFQARCCSVRTFMISCLVIVLSN